MRPRLRTRAFCLPLCSAALCLLLASFAAAQDSKAAPTGQDPLLQAMRAELQRSMAGLKLPGVPAPYYIEYSVTDVDQYAADSVFGARRSQVRTHTRLLRAVVRVGDYKQDSYFGQGQGTFELMPLDDDVAALRHALWLATDRAYKMAAEALTAKQAMLQQYQVEYPVDDFARAPALESIQPLARLNLGGRDWGALLDSATALYRRDPELQSVDAWLRFVALNRYLVNSEGTTVRTGETVYQLNLSATTQAADGMNLARDNGYVTTAVAELPSDQQFRDFAANLLGTLRDLRSAPIVDDEYHGPVLFSPDAASTVVERLLGANILGVKPRPGESARTSGAFATSYKGPVLPDFVSLVDDPTVASFRGRALVGAYAVDDEGVKALPVTVVDKGILVNYLLGREPIRDFPSSNGHARVFLPSAAGLAPRPSLGSLFLRSSRSVPPEELKKKLLDICRERGLPYGYYVETFGPRLAPRLLYRVYVSDGHQQLVRGATMSDLDTRSLRTDLVAVADDAAADNRLEAVPVSVITPSLLVDQLGVLRSSGAKETLPQYPPPALPGGK